VLITLFTVIAATLIRTQRIPGRVANDQIVYHEPTIRHFIATWPTFDFVDYLSATTPGYHLLLAAVARMIHPAPAVLQGCSAVIACGLLALLAATTGRRTGSTRAIWLCLPVALSPYVVQSGAWLLPDNLAWLGVLAVMLLALSPLTTTTADGTRRLLGLLALLPALVFVRQNHIWTIVPVAASIWMFAAPEGGACTSLFGNARRRLPRAAAILLVTAPAVVMLACFRHLWGGFTPPRFTSFHAGLNPSTPAFVLAMLGTVSVFFVATLAPALRDAWTHGRNWVWLGAASGMAFATFFPTTYDMGAGRWSGLWNIGKQLPTVGHTSLFIAPLAVLGGVALVGWLWPRTPAERAVILVAFAGFTAAQSANSQLWQRYVEPFVFIIVAVLASRMTPRRNWTEAAGVIALCAALVALNLVALRNFPLMSEAVPPGTLPEGGVFPKP